MVAVGDQVKEDKVKEDSHEKCLQAEVAKTLEPVKTVTIKLEDESEDLKRKKPTPTKKSAKRLKMDDDDE